MLPLTSNFSWVYGIWLSDNSNKLGITSKDIPLISNFKTEMKKYFSEFESPFVRVFLKKGIRHRQKIKIVNKLKSIQISEDKIRFYVNSKQYGERVFQLFVNKKELERLFREQKEKYHRLFTKRNVVMGLLAGKLDGDGNVNVSRGIIEWYYISSKSLKQLKKDYKILKRFGFEPSIRKHKTGKALVVGSKKKNFKKLMRLSKELKAHTRLERNRILLKKLSRGKRIREKDLKIVNLIKRGLDTGEKLRKELNYSPRTMRQLLQNLSDAGYVERERKNRNEFYKYTVVTSSCSDDTKDESLGRDPD